jgi:hypothetical protein
MTVSVVYVGMFFHPQLLFLCVAHSRVQYEYLFTYCIKVIVSLIEKVIVSLIAESSTLHEESSFAQCTWVPNAFADT